MQISASLKLVLLFTFFFYTVLSELKRLTVFDVGGKPVKTDPRGLSPFYRWRCDAHSPWGLVIQGDDLRPRRSEFRSSLDYVEEDPRLLMFSRLNTSDGSL